MRSLEGKVAVVTGAGSGIGRAEALSLAARAAAVVVNDIDPGPADDVVTEIVAAGGRAVANHDDVAAWKSGHAIVEQAVDTFGRLDIVVTNAGIVRRSPITQVTEADLNAQIAVLFKGTYTVIHHAAVHWKSEYEAGNRTHRAVVATSSSAGVPGGVQEFSVYGAMKAAIAALAVGAALEFRPFGVTVNAILPHAATRMDAMAKGQAGVPVYDPTDPDPLNPQHVANVVTYLASEKAAWLSGQVLEITGTNVRRWLPWAANGEIDSAAQWTAGALDTALATGIYRTLPGGRVIPKR
jgi:NAD(P)-dependent dehydrogenase (short-subunit alcohol dehydrogenase family)